MQQAELLSDLWAQPGVYAEPGPAAVSTRDQRIASGMTDVPL